jgi:hypothetical protein
MRANQHDKDNSTAFLMTKTGQSALEYMMTYGWAILIIVIVAVILYSMGIFSPSSSVSFTSSGFSPFTVSSAVCSQAGLNLEITAGGLPNNAVSATITKIYFQSNTGTTAKLKEYTPLSAVTVSAGNSAEIIIPTVACNSAGTTFSLSSKLQYSYSTAAGNVVINATGVISGKSSTPLVGNFTNSSYVTLQNSTSLYNIWHGGNHYTLSLWVNLKKVYSSCTTFSTPNSNTCNSFIQEQQGCTSGLIHSPLNTTGYNVQVAEWNGTSGCSAGASQFSSPALYVPYNRWKLITGVLNEVSANDYTLTVCVDAQCVSSATFSANSFPNIYTDAFTFIVGTYQLSGKAADVQIYNASLSQSQIQMLYNQGIDSQPILTNNLVAWLPLNGNGYDYSGNGNTGGLNSIVFTQS